VYIGNYLDVNVTVRNKGTEVESFDVVLYYDESIVAGVLHVDGLVASAERMVVFHWQTNGVSAGNHTLIANAKPVHGETIVGDNTLVDGQVEFGVAPGGLCVPDWLYWFLLLLLLLLLMLLLLLWYYRKRKEDKASFYAGWTAWYYGYDPRVKPRKRARGNET
jgi:H+/Cl- antiporter ClcA